MLFTEFMERVHKLFPEGEVIQEAGGYLSIDTGWKMDPDEPDYVYHLSESGNDGTFVED